MNILRKIFGRNTARLEARLEKFAGNRKTAAAWLRSIAKHVYHPEVEVYRDARGIIRHVRIGPWRIIAASKSRRIAEVRDLTCGRVVVRIERGNASQGIAPSTIWELYNLEGHLLALLQSVPDQDIWLATDFQSPHGAPQKPEPRSLNPISHPSASVAGGLLGLGPLPCSG